MADSINIALNPSEIAMSKNYNDSLAVLRAGFYPAERNHCIFRGFNNRQYPFDIPYHYNEEIHVDVLDEAIIIYCIDGEGFFISETCQHEIKKGSLIFCDKNVVHAYGSNPDNPWTIYWVHFTGNFSLLFSQSIQASNEKFSVKNIGCVIQYIQSMQRVCQLLKPPTNQLKISTANSYFKICLSEILLSLQGCSDTTSEMSETINDVILYMQQHISSNLTLESMANYADLSKYYFSHQFKKVTGHPPIQYFNQMKIQKACDLLTRSNKSIKEISITLGFSTSYYFSNLFKEYIGISPSRYRELTQTKY